MKNLVCTQIPEDQKYWFVRTDAGKNYKDFLDNDYIGISYEMLSIEKIKELASRDGIKSYLKDSGYKTRNLGLAISNIERFIYSMKIGDAVVIPSGRSNRFAFGYIASEPYMASNEEKNIGTAHFSKRRKIKWVDEVDASQMDRKFLLLRFAQAAISSANDYAEYIDNVIGGYFYCKGDKGNLMLAAGKDGNIPVAKLANFLNATLAYAKCLNPEMQEDDLKIKINLQSRGTIKFSGAVLIISAIACAILASTKEEVSIEASPYCTLTPTPEVGIKTSFTLKGESLLKQISDFKRENAKTELLQLQAEKEKLQVEAMKKQLAEKDKTKESK